MEWTVILIGTLLVFSMLWLIIVYKRELGKDRKLFDEYLEKQRRIKFNEEVEDFQKKDGNY